MGGFDAQLTIDFYGFGKVTNARNGRFRSGLTRGLKVPHLVI